MDRNGSTAAATASEDNNSDNNNNNKKSSSSAASTFVRYRRAGPTDILKCAKIGAPQCRRSKRELQYWQHHASPYFVCAIFHDDNADDDEEDDNDNDDSNTETQNNDNHGNSDVAGHVDGVKISSSSSNNSAMGESNVDQGDSSGQKRCGSSTIVENNSNTNSSHQQDHHTHHDDHDDHHDEDDVILGFISGIRFDVADSDDNYGPNDEMLVEKSPHSPKGKILAVRAVVVRTDEDDIDGIEDSELDESYKQNRSLRIKKARTNLRQVMLKHYISKMKHINRSAILGDNSVDQQHGDKKKRPPMEKLVAVCWSNELPMYLDCGFTATRVSKASGSLFSPIMNTDATGSSDRSSAKSDTLFYLELSLMPTKQEIAREFNLNRVMLTEQSLSLSMSSTKDASTSSPECFIVDSFTDRPGCGNPAAVVLLQEGFDPTNKKMVKWMKMVAAEFNLAETAFCWPSRRSNSSSNNSNSTGSNQKNELHWNIRYYTPIVEMPLCGHATLASAAVLYQNLSYLQPGLIVFHALQDILTMRLAEDVPALATDRISRISMDFPPKPAEELTTRDDRSCVKNMLSNAFGGIDLESEMLFVGKSDLGDLLIELKPEVFANIGYDSLNFKAFLEWDGYFRGVVICCKSTDMIKKESSSESDELEDVDVDFLSRFFAPKAGIDEDDVTGSAHCILGPYFAKKLKKDIVIGRQVSKRSGIIECRVSPDCVTLTGSAVVIMSGRLHM